MGIGGLGMGEMIVIFLVVLLLFGAKRLPEIGSSLGKGIREFKGSIREIEKEVKKVDEPRHDEVPPKSAAADEPDEEPRRLTTSPPPGSPEVQSGGVPTADSQAADVPPDEDASDAEPSPNWSAAIDESAEIPEGEAEEESSTEEGEEQREKEA